LEGAKKRLGSVNEVFTNVFFVGSPFRWDEEFRRRFILSGKDIFRVEVLFEALGDLGKVRVGVARAGAEFKPQSEQGAKVERRVYFVGFTEVMAGHSVWALEVEPAWHVGN
jgi:hypothetical protein